MTSIVRSTQAGRDDLHSLRARAADLEKSVAERADEVARVQADLAAFRIRYKQDVGTLHDELEELEHAIAELELGELSKLVDDDDHANPIAPPSAAVPKLTSDAVRKLFRDVAKTIHPDLARDEDTRDRRHALMVEANRAYALGDEERLRSILDAWENSPEAVQGDDAESMRLRLERRITQFEHQLNACAAELAALRASPLAQLKTQVDEAAARGKDLVADMVRRLKRDIVAARNRLDAMRWDG
jgi:molecular chaperone GrpE (heat shock protein)